MAAHHLDSDDVERGKDLFGKQSLSSEQNQRASVLFLQKLLRYFVCWANSIKGTTNRGALRIKKHFDDLVKRGLKFPQQEPELNEALMEDMAKCYRAISKLYSLIDRGCSDEARLEKYASKVMSFKSQIEAEISHLSGKDTSSIHMEVLIRTNDDLDEAIQRYSSFISSRVSPSKGRRQLSSIDLINLLDSPGYTSPSKAPEVSYFDDLMEISMQSFEEPPISLRHKEPPSKVIPKVIPTSPRALEKSEAKYAENLKEQVYLERSLRSDFHRLFETGPGALEEEYGQLQARCDQLEEAYFTQTKTIENLKVELVNANETIIMQQSEKEALKEIIRAQDSFKREIEQVREELQEKQSRIEQYERKLKILNETLEALHKEHEESQGEEEKSPSDKETELAEPSALERSQSDIVRHFDFSTEDLGNFMTAPPIRFSFENSYNFGIVPVFSAVESISPSKAIELDDLGNFKSLQGFTTS
eukprot:CAMPEP_0204917272 /NCGR_PEP_ID=MMETSP1397-20131031/14892_1 /ASSEMBLY_ACC=CAM_ASM_000891 /TAXON_ID=49980 /ORGANISM="Climacostomum Climacostomum virens, Strain Stock W-24" /LENGTH=474 /DNA_ID=CAMNT_0052090063 /DNA_START=250 /DNA_END=1674 /DNA_ORIENTATION=-